MEITHTTVTISWNPPDYDGSAALISYLIESRDSMSNIWQRVARVKPQYQSYTVRSLNEDYSYYLRVFAENIEGFSEPLVLDCPVRPCRPRTNPEPPAGRIKVRRVTSDTVDLEWGVPFDDGGSKILRYIVEYREIDSFYWNEAVIVDYSTRSCTISGLKENCDYLFRIITETDYGRSIPLEVDLALKPARRSGKI